MSKHEQECRERGSPKNSIMRPCTPMDHCCQDFALSNAHSSDTVQLKDATSRCPMGSKRLSCRALYTERASIPRLHCHDAYVLTGTCIGLYTMSNSCSSICTKCSYQECRGNKEPLSLCTGRCCAWCSAEESEEDVNKLNLVRA